jgi:bifunctional UDP-N-acetylglucosamine pyrophosphorylase/glucosamine-1-phosphate N-acetyltransferase
MVKKENKQYFTGFNKLGAIVGRDVKVGINASLMPGILVGKNSLVGAGMVLNQNIEDNRVCYKKTNLVIKNKVIK